MSRAVAVLDSSLRTLKLGVTPAGAHLPPLRTANTLRRRHLSTMAGDRRISRSARQVSRSASSATAFARAPSRDFIHDGPPPDLEWQPPTYVGDSSSSERPDPMLIPTPENPKYPKPNPWRRGALYIPPLTHHLNKLFEPLVWPDELARRVLTHGSHLTARKGHNNRFSFIGRRVLDAYLQLFIHSCPETLPPSLDLEATMETALNTYVLGEHVASAWNLYPIVLWTPTLPSSKKTSRAETEVEAQRDAEKGLIDGFDLRTLKTSGLYKVHGEAVQAIIGGVYHQFGGAVAERIFYTRILPHILLPGRKTGLADPLHAEAMRAHLRRGGPNGPLLSPGSKLLSEAGIGKESTGTRLSEWEAKAGEVENGV